MVESNTATTTTATTTTTTTTIRTPLSSSSFQEGNNDNSNDVIDTTTTTILLPVSVDHHPTNHDNDDVPDANNHDTTNNNNNVNQDYSNNNINVQFTDMEYAMESFYTIVQPVFCTMVLSALAVIYISTPESYADTEEALATTYYVVQSNTETDTNTQQFGNSLLNALVIVSVICGLTFVIVLLYKYNCIKCLTGYMILAMGLLLGNLAAGMFRVFLERYTIYLDKISFAFIMYNFAIVGVISVFSGGPGSTIRIVPVYMNQVYLVLTSVIVAWQLSHFDPWTAWVLLVVLAFYDLFAVLTPCGPLKALVHLMQRDNAPNMPGLLYEASLSTGNNNTRTTSRENRRRGNQRPQRRGQEQTTNADTSDNRTDTSSTIQSEQHQVPRSNNYDNIPSTNTSNPDTSGITPATSVTAIPTSHHHTNATILQSTADMAATHDDSINNNIGENDAAVGSGGVTVYDVDSGEPSTLYYYTSDTNEAVEVSQPLIHNTAMIPFALAKLYKLPFRSDPQPPWITQRHHNNNQTQQYGATTTNTTTTTTTPSSSTTENIVYTPAQLHQLVEVIFPNGGRIVPTISLDTPVAELYRRTQHRDQYQTRYTVIDSHGVHKRVLFVNEIDGRVFEDLREENMMNERRDRVRNSIKLGLGDFIFYSILVSKAALYSYTTFVVCTLAVLSGLGITLLLLAIYGQALPALPVSILLGVVFFVLTRYVIEPWVEAMYISRVYV